jgi:hypothetical protein
MFYAVVIQMTDDAAPPPQSPALSSRNDKRERKQTAQILPQGITHNMMNKYVVYYREMVYLKNGKQVPREYFKVESHPKLDKPWVTSKSTKVSLLEKLNDANEYVMKLSASASASASTSASATELPKYTMLRVVRDTPTATILSLVYDRKDKLNGFRWTCSHTFSSPTTTAVALEHLQDKLREKYGVNIAGM